MTAVIAAATYLGAGAALAQQPDLVVGTTAVLSGTNARSGQEQLHGVQLWVADVNQRGGLLGRRVQLKHYDDRGEFETVAGLYEKLIGEDRVDLLIGPYGAEPTAAAAAVAERHRLPLPVPSVAPIELWARGYKQLFGLHVPTATSMHGVLDFAKGKGLRRIALVYQATAFGRELADGVRVRARGLGLRIVLEEAYDKELTDFTAVVEQLKLRRPDVIIAAAHLPDAVALLRHAQEQRLSAKVMAFAGGAHQPEFGRSLGAAVEGAIGASAWEPTLKIAGVADFARRYKAKHGYAPGALGASGYAAGQVLEAAARKAGSTDPGALRQALAELDTMTVLGRFRVDANGKQIGKPAYLVQWINGERVPILPSDVALAEAIYPFKRWTRR
jgi:branched-chain amino acid transport system substrate-binding protein